MRVNIKKSVAIGTVAAPPSKSDAHRLLICAGLSKGKSAIRGIEFSEDIKATVDCLRALNVDIETDGNTVYVDGTNIDTSDNRILNCRESGSTLRFFIPICLLSGKKTVLQGSGRLFKRPLDTYSGLCREQGIEFSADGDSVTVCGCLKSGDYTVRGDISSQFISGLLFALPILEGDSRIHIIPPVESLPYINMTLSTLKRFSVECVFEDSNTLFIKGGQSYMPKNLSAEGDWSNAAFLDGFNYLGGSVNVSGLTDDSLQGDKIYRQYFEKLKKGAPTIDIRDCPDLGPVLMALAAANNGAVFTGTKRLKIKESDRGEAMKEELSKFRVKVDVFDDKITVSSGISAPTELLSSHNDHRIAMSMALLCTQTGGTIDGAEAVNKSFPDFFERIKKLGIEVEYET